MVAWSPPDPALASDWLVLLQTNALSLGSRILIGTGKSLGQQINITTPKRNVFLLNQELSQEEDQGGPGDQRQGGTDSE